MRSRQDGSNDLSPMRGHLRDVLGVAPGIFAFSARISSMAFGRFVVKCDFGCEASVQPGSINGEECLGFSFAGEHDPCS